jgi:hypothetical protein
MTSAKFSNFGATARPFASACVIAVAVCALAVRPALAFHRRLTPDQVRAAYYIGRDPNHRQAFFTQYVHTPPLPDTGPDVASIEFRTPYEQIAIRSRDSIENYFPQDAEQDYATNPIREVIVLITIDSTPTFYFPLIDQVSPEYNLRGFKFRVTQNERALDYRNLTAQDVVGTGGESVGSGTPPGIEAYLHLAASQFKSDAPVTVEVIAPTGQSYSTTFDLAQLK